MPLTPTVYITGKNPGWDPSTEISKSLVRQLIPKNSAEIQQVTATEFKNLQRVYTHPDREIAEISGKPQFWDRWYRYEGTTVLHRDASKAGGFEVLAVYQSIPA